MQEALLFAIAIGLWGLMLWFGRYESPESGIEKNF